MKFKNEVNTSKGGFDPDDMAKDLGYNYVCKNFESQAEIRERDPRRALEI